MAKTPQDRDIFDDEATMIEPEAVLRFMLFKTADRQTYRPFGVTMWSDKATVLGTRYSYGKKHALSFPDYSEEPGTYISALKPIVQRIPLPDRPDKLILALTVFLATPELFDEIEEEGTDLNPVGLPDDLGTFDFPE
ncbi:MAG: hypothetical protein EOO88_23290 [Pedobacter sp.]|nr:MAG: hypothetical protein EOO88_23290 [Pedobacter sp.]